MQSKHQLQLKPRAQVKRTHIPSGVLSIRFLHIAILVFILILGIDNVAKKDNKIIAVSCSDSIDNSDNHNFAKFALMQLEQNNKKRNTIQPQHPIFDDELTTSPSNTNLLQNTSATTRILYDSEAGGESTRLVDHVTNILIPRVSGTKGNLLARKYIVETLKSSGYSIELDEFSDNTPIGQVRFANIIATNNPNASNYLLFACHYDSKKMEGFLGASDSAVPCAIILKLAQDFKNSHQTSELALKFVFFDGEEAFVEWTDTDSLYGSRHLAEKWSKTNTKTNESKTVIRNNKQVTINNELDKIELFILLDLIGTKDTNFVAFHHSTRDLFRHCRNLEREVSFDVSPRRQTKNLAWSNNYMPYASMQDDHVPFQKRKVPILLLLSAPFPSVWHTVDDNFNNIDWELTERVYKVMNKFISTYDDFKKDRNVTLK